MRDDPATGLVRRFLASPMLTATLAVALAFSIMLWIPQLGAYHLPGNQQDYEPAQPIAFSHRLHAGELQVSCVYCHFAVEKGRHAGIPPANVCMNCHRFVTAPLGAVQAEDERAKKENRSPRRIVSPEIQKIYDALALGPDLKPDPTKTPVPIAWNKVHSLPDFVYFDHRGHMAQGVACQQCHGPVETMERVRQVSDLSMGWCVNCHRNATRNGIDAQSGGPAAPGLLFTGGARKVHASTDCATCHY